MFEIYAELTKKLKERMDSGFVPTVPYGVSMYRKNGSRVCYFEIDEDVHPKEDGLPSELEDFLDRNGVPWQES